MAQATFGSPIKKTYGETVSLTTTAAHLAFRPKYQEVMFYCASAWRMAITPRLASVKYYSDSGGTYTDYTRYATDRLAADATRIPLDAMAAADYLYLGVTEPTRGFYFDVGDSVNSEAAGLDWEYSSAISAGAGTFSDVAGDSDGTKNSQTLDQDGLYAFTLPSAVRGAINDLSSEPLYWYRFKPSIPLSATVDVYNIIPAADTVNYGYMEAGISYQLSLNLANGGAFEFDHTGSATLNVTWIQH